MNSSTISAGMRSSVLEILAIARSSSVFRPLVEEHADFRELLIQAAVAAAIAKWKRISALACEDLGRLLKELVPTGLPIGEDVSSAPN